MTPPVSRRHFLQSAATVAGAVALPHAAQAAESREASESVRAGASTLKVTSTSISLRINGVPHEVTIEPRVTLLDVLREQIGLTGTKKGCGRGQCGACTVLVNGRRINSCLALAVMHVGDEITTIEGLAREDGSLHPIQAAFLRHDAFQCGYCTPGQICSAVGLLEELRHGSPPLQPLSDDAIRESMSGNICRCGAYPHILAAIREVAQA
jgi:xanthine dehydrogenase YagT iron-sulfur-binding subunit